jgi:sugar phosphate isomerase/epimerase
MHLGLSFSIFGKATCVMGGSSVVPDESHFRQCREAGVEHVEVTIMEGYLPPGDRAAVEQVARFAERYGVRVNSVHGPSGWPTNGHWLADADPAVRRLAIAERIQAMEGAARLGARYMVVEYEAYPNWPFWPHGQPPVARFPDARVRWRESLEQLLAPAARAGIRLALENIDDLPSADLAAELDTLDPALVGVCFDASHAAYGGRLEAELDLLASRLIGTHLSDNDCLAGPEYSDRHWRPGLGALDWSRLLHRLATETACDCLILEILDRERPWLNPELLAAYRELERLLAQESPASSSNPPA